MVDKEPADKQSGEKRSFKERALELFEKKSSRPEPEPRVSRPALFPSAGAGAVSKVPTPMLYIFLLFLGGLGLFLKVKVGYHPGLSFIISVVLFFLFLIFVNSTPEAKMKRIFVLATFLMDLFVAQGGLLLLPDSEAKNIFIAIHVFDWIILSLILFVMGVGDALDAGQRLGAVTWTLLIILFGGILYVALPQAAESFLIYQDTTHAEYFNIAKEQLAKVGKTLQETRNTGADYFSCTFSATSAAVQYNACLEDKRIARYCKNNVETTKEQEECIQQQKELAKQGGRPGVAGSVSEAIKEITKVELKEDEYFPKKTMEVRERYPVTLEVKNPRELIFGVHVSCVFKQSKLEVPGTIFIFGQEETEIQVTGKESQIQILCQPTADLKGKYTLEYSAVLSGMQTFSFLKRAFVSKGIDKTVREQIEADNFKGKERASQGPAEFALLNFKFGTGDGTQPLVLVEEPVTFSFSVADIIDRSGWQVLKVNSYSFSSLLERGFSVDEQKIGDKDCLQGGEIKVSEALTKRREPSELKRCFLILPPDLKSLKGNAFEVETFVADLNYDYKITKSISNIEVTPLTPELVS